VESHHDVIREAHDDHVAVCPLLTPRFGPTDRIRNEDTTGRRPHPSHQRRSHGPRGHDKGLFIS
jgi:hypothetical protein